MSTTNDTNYNYLWDGTEPGWVLVGDKSHIDELAICNRKKQAAFLMEDEATMKRLIRKMLESGVEVVASLSGGNVQVERA